MKTIKICFEFKKSYINWIILIISVSLSVSFLGMFISDLIMFSKEYGELMSKYIRCDCLYLGLLFIAPIIVSIITIFKTEL